MIAANPNGTGSIQIHVLGTDPKNTPYISATDATQQVTPKNYGDNQIEINTRDLQRDINAGNAPQGIEIISPAKLQEALQDKINAAQIKYENNPTKASKESLDRAKKALEYATRDAECLIRKCVPAPNIKRPNAVLPKTIQPVKH